MRFQAIGECMVEIARVPGGTARLDYSGDALNTAVYMQRVSRAIGADISTHFLTGLGDDSESQLMHERWIVDRIEGDQIVVPGASPGLYLISTDRAGERSFAHWRHESAAAQVFAGTIWIDRIQGSIVYLTGSLKLMSQHSHQELARRLTELRAGGTRVVFDSNFRKVVGER